MELVLRGLQWHTLLIYLDDIIICGPTVEEHLRRLDEVFTHLGKAGLKLKPSKCSLLQEQVAFLGHLVTPDGLKPAAEKVKVIKTWPTPRNITDVRAFLELCSYYRRFIPGFSSRASPLNDLLQAGQVFEWTTECQASFADLKSALTRDELVAYPIDQGTYILDTDASNTAIGATLSQLQWSEKLGREDRPIAFASKSLAWTKRRYCVTRQELLAVVTFMQQFRHYLLGRQFIVRTDHSALCWVMTFKEPRDQMARWLEILSQFDFKIEHRDGRKHQNADALSRVPCDPHECDCYDEQSILQEVPCGGCSTCMKRHEEWSEFMDMDDVVPLSAKRVQGQADGPCNEGQLEVPREGWLTSCGRPWGTWVQAIVHTVVMILTCFPFFVGTTASKVQLTWNTSLSWVRKTIRRCSGLLKRKTEQGHRTDEASIRGSNLHSQQSLGGGLLKCRGVWSDRPLILLQLVITVPWTHRYPGWEDTQKQTWQGCSRRKQTWQGCSRRIQTSAR